MPSSSQFLNEKNLGFEQNKAYNSFNNQSYNNESSHKHQLYNPNVTFVLDSHTDLYSITVSKNVSS